MRKTTNRVLFGCCFDDDDDDVVVVVVVWMLLLVIAVDGGAVPGVSHAWSVHVCEAVS